MAGTTLGSAYVQIVPSAQGIKGSIEGVLGGEAQSAGTSIGSTIGSFAKKALAAGAVIKVAKDMLEEGAKLQQSYIGGLETLYGDAAGAARDYAKEAAAAGISMNDYSEQAVSFGAALKAAYGGDTMAAAEAANTAILDMADNAAKMGTPLESVQQAYQGFAKGQYQLLDNLKLGYGGTKSEMERLLADAQELTGVEYDINNLGDVYNAIHAVQGELGLTGVAADEAAGTLSGSFAAVKANFQNFIGSMAIGESIQEPLNGLLESISTFAFDNLIPMIGTIVEALPGAIVTLIKKGVPMLLSGILDASNSIADKVANFAKGVSADKVSAWTKTMLPKMLAAAGKIIGHFATGMHKNAGKVLLAIGKIGLAIIKGLGSAIWGKITQAANGIKDRFLQPINALKDKVRGIIDNIKAFFSFSVPIPHIPLPHFSISPAGWKVGDLLKGSIPSLGVSWYKKAEDTPFMFGNATLFGAGERNDEILYGRSALMRDISEAVGNGGEIVINLNYDAGSDATDMVRDLARGVRRYRMAGAI